jgi:hypothetical protein
LQQRACQLSTAANGCSCLSLQCRRQLSTLPAKRVSAVLSAAWGTPQQSCLCRQARMGCCVRATGLPWVAAAAAAAVGRAAGTLCGRSLAGLVRQAHGLGQIQQRQQQQQQQWNGGGSQVLVLGLVMAQGRHHHCPRERSNSSSSRGLGFPSAPSQCAS